jgi:glycosyltransferase involved in cell wall biosynthesis
MNVSAIIPTRNRAAALQRTLESLAQVDRADQALELIVVDNGSTDETRAVFARASARFAHLAWKYCSEPVPGLLSGRHRGAREATGEICAFLDDDVRVSGGWLTAVREAFHRPDVVLAGGPSAPLFATTPPAWLEEFWTSDAKGRLCTWRSLFDGGPTGKPIDPCYVLGLNFAIRRATLFQFGGFHPDCLPAALQRFQGDGETGLSLKLQRAGLLAVYHPGMAVQHEVPAQRLTPDYFEQRAYYQGVCDSYAAIRSTGAIGRPGNSWRNPWRRARRLLRQGRLITKPEAKRVWQLADGAYDAGYRFHQDAVAGDPALLEWVLREDYLDCPLPPGWERFAGGEQAR